MEFTEIDSYLQKFKGTRLRPNILEELSELKRVAVTNDDQEVAKNIWCLEQVYKITNHYLTAFKDLTDKEFFQAWCELDRADIELHFLRDHLNYSGNKYNLEFIEKNINQLQKLFPYQYFSSRESTVKNWTCSICNHLITLRNSCDHKVGEIYNGEQCVRIAGDIEFHGIALVTNPFDKYAVLFPEDKEYNYAILENLLKNWTSPYEKWKLNIVKEITDEYKDLGRNQPCICKSGKKYKNCCLKTGKDTHDHYRLLFLEKDPKKFKTMKKQVISTWKK